MPHDGLDPLDPRFPIAKTLPPSCFWEMAHLRPDRAAIAGLTARAREDEATYQEAFVLAAPLPAEDLPAVTFAHEVPYLALAPAALAHEHATLAGEASA